MDTNADEIIKDLDFEKLVCKLKTTIKMYKEYGIDEIKIKFPEFKNVIDSARNFKYSDDYHILYDCIIPTMIGEYYPRTSEYYNKIMSNVFSAFSSKVENILCSADEYINENLGEYLKTITYETN